MQHMAFRGKPWAIEFHARELRFRTRTFSLISKAALCMPPIHRRVCRCPSICSGKKSVTAAKYRDRTFKKLMKSPSEYSDVQKYERDGWALTDCMVRDDDEVKSIDQKDIVMYQSKWDTWIDCHLPKVRFKESDTTIFDDFINSIRFIQPYRPWSLL